MKCVKWTVSKHEARDLESESTPLRVLLTSPLGRVDQVDQRCLSLLPSTGLKTAIWVDEQQRVGEELEHGTQTLLDLLASRDTRRVDIVNTRTDLVRISVVLEGLEQLHVALGRLDRDDIGIQALDRREDIIEIGVTEVRVGLGGIGNASSGETEGINGPGEIVIPISTTKRKLETNNA